MPVRHHPSAQVRADYSAAVLPPGAALAVTVHLEFCSVCAIAVQAMDGFPEPLASEARAGGKASSPDARLPHPLQSIRQGSWRTVRPKVRAAQLQQVSGLGEAVWLVEAGRGAMLPLSREQGVWGAVFLAGEARRGETIFGAGDFVEADHAGAAEAAVAAEVLALLVTDASWGRSLWSRLADGWRGGGG